MFDLEYYNNITDFGKEFKDFTSNKDFDWKIQKQNHISNKNKLRLNNNKQQGEVDAVLNWGHLIGMGYIEWYMGTIKVSKKYKKKVIRDEEFDENEHEIETRARKLKVNLKQ
jgi:hypothetical protein